MNIAQLETKSGPYYEHWERKCLLWAQRLSIARQARLDNPQTDG